MVGIVDQLPEGFGYRDPRGVLPKQFGAHLDVQTHKLTRRHLTQSSSSLVVEAHLEEVDEHARSEGRCLGAASRANTSMTIMRSPQHGHGRGCTRG